MWEFRGHNKLHVHIVGIQIKMFLLVILFVILAFLTYTYLKKKHFYWKNIGVKQLDPISIFGNLSENVYQQKAFSEVIMESYNKMKNYRYFGFYQFFTPMLVINDPDLIIDITVKHFDHFVDRQAHSREDVDYFWSKSVVALRGKDWHAMRSTLSPVFTGSKMRFMFPLVDECCQNLVDHLKSRNEKVLTLEMKDCMGRVTNDVIASCALGIKCDSMADPDNEFFKICNGNFDLSGTRSLVFFLYTSFPTLMKLVGMKIFNTNLSNFFTRIIRETIEIRETNKIVRPDLIHLMLQSRKGNFEEEQPQEDQKQNFATTQSYEYKKSKKVEMTEDDIIAQALIFYFAGFDSLAQFMTFVTYELAVNNDVQDKLRREIEESIGDGKLDYQNIMSMTYLDMVISEVLRKWPLATTTDRMCTKDYTIKPKSPNEVPVHLKVGDVIMFPNIGIHRDPKFYPNPEKFDPERFSDNNKAKININTYIPFGVGPRFCIGNRFALLECKILVVHLLKNFEIVPVEKTMIPLKLSTKHFLMSAEGGMWLGFKKL